MLNKIKSDLKRAMLSRDSARCDALRMIIGEIPRLNLKADQEPTDEQIFDIIKKLIKSELIVLEYSGQDTSEYVDILEEYIPTMMSEKQILNWIEENVDLNKFNPKVKAMRIIMKSLKGKADGALVRGLLSK
jgi:uncharacterized protein YqeY